MAIIRDCKEKQEQKLIIYTMGNAQINETVQKVLFEKGYRWKENIPDKETTVTKYYINKNERIVDYGITGPGHIREEGHKELTFREFMELPPVHDEEEKLAEAIVNFILKYAPHTSKKGSSAWLNERDWCAIWEKMKPKLGL